MAAVSVSEERAGHQHGGRIFNNIPNTFVLKTSIEPEIAWPNCLGVFVHLYSFFLNRNAMQTNPVYRVDAKQQ